MELNPNYKISEKQGKKEIYLDVRASLEYLQPKEKVRNPTLQDFSDLNSYCMIPTLNRKKCLRIFNVPGKRIKNKGWNTELDLKENKILFQYLLFNQKLQSVDTYLTFFDQSKLNEKEKLRQLQDYTLKMQYNSKSKATLENMASWWKTEFVINKENKVVSRVYPSFIDTGDEAMLKWHQESLNKPGNIIFFLEDFHRRACLLEEKNPNFKIYDLKDQNLVSKEWLSRLNINLLKKENIQNLVEDIEKIGEKIIYKDPYRTL